MIGCYLDDPRCVLDCELEVIAEAEDFQLRGADVKRYFRPLREYGARDDFCQFPVDSGLRYYDSRRRVVKPRPKQPPPEPLFEESSSRVRANGGTPSVFAERNSVPADDGNSSNDEPIIPLSYAVADYNDGLATSFLFPPPEMATALDQQYYVAQDDGLRYRTNEEQIPVPVPTEVFAHASNAAQMPVVAPQPSAKLLRQRHGVVAFKQTAMAPQQTSTIEQPSPPNVATGNMSGKPNIPDVPVYLWAVGGLFHGKLQQ